MRSFLRAQAQIRRRWLLATAIVPALLIADASQLTASANPMMRGGPMHHHRGGGGFGAGVGVGIGVGIGAMMINQMQRQQAQNAQQAPANQKAQKPAAKKDGGKAATSKNKKKDAPGLANRKDDPNASGKNKDDPNASGKNQDNPALTTKKDEPGPAGRPPSATPALTSNQVVAPVPAPPPANCNDCLPLWEAIVRHHKAIVADIEKLRRAKLELEDNKASRAKLVVQLRTAAPADKQSFQTLIDYTDQTIAHRTMFNDELEKIIEEEKARLAELIAEYQRCVDKLCAKKITEAPPPPPPSVPEPPVTPTPPPSVPEPPVTQTPPPIKVVVTPPPQPTPASTSRGRNQKICGPDVTDMVLDALAELRKQYEANPEKRDEACSRLIDPDTGAGAWDISALAPHNAPVKDSTYDPASDRFVGPDGSDQGKPWFTSVSDQCATPRPVCGATVEFLGTCQHSQVVNYTQWGMMMALCGGNTERIGKAMHSAYNAWTYGFGAPGGAQDSMVAMGKGFKAEQDAGAGTIVNSMKDWRESIKRRMQQQLQQLDKDTTRSEKDCALVCTLTDKQRKALKDNFSWRASWSGLTHTSSSRR
jgi:hypothetical protein